MSKICSMGRIIRQYRDMRLRLCSDRRQHRQLSRSVVRSAISSFIYEFGRLCIAGFMCSNFRFLSRCDMHSLTHAACGSIRMNK